MTKTKTWALIATQQPLLFSQAERVASTKQKYLRTALIALFPFVPDGKKGASPDVFLREIPNAARAWCESENCKKRKGTVKGKTDTCNNYFGRMAKLALMAADQVAKQNPDQAERLRLSCIFLKNTKNTFSLSMDAFPQSEKANQPLGKENTSNTAGVFIRSSSGTKNDNKITLPPDDMSADREPVAVIIKPDGTRIEFF